MLTSTFSGADALTTRGVATAPGVYGLQLRGLQNATLLSEVDLSAPSLEISIEIGRATGRVESFQPDHAEISLVDYGWVSLSRSGRAHFVLPSQLPVDEVLHPWLVPAAATFNGWCGRHVLHGGAFAQGKRAVAVLGNKEDGKSSLLAWLAQGEDVEVLTDDLIVVQDGAVFSGPRCIDLRPGAAEPLGRAGSRLVRGQSRLRLELPPCRPKARLDAIVVLAWGAGPDVVLRPLSATLGLAALLPHALNAGQGDLLALIGTPVWVLERPRTWDSMGEVKERLLSLLP
jgi:hypothetical protein